MDYISEAERLRLYYKGLSEAGGKKQLASVYPDIVSDVEDPDNDTTIKECSEYLLNTMLPLYHKLAYVNNNRFIHEDLSLFEPLPQRLYTASEIYAALQTFAPYAVGEIIRTIGCSSATLAQLQQAFSSQDKAAFTNIIDTQDCDLSLVSSVCEYLWPLYIHQADPTEEDIISSLDAVAGILRYEQHPISRSSQKLSEAVEPYLDGGDEESYLQKLEQYNYDAFDSLCSFYRDNYDRFKPKERKQIEPIILNGGGSIDGEFNLPDDYFSIRNESDHFEEFFGLHPDVVKAGSGQFELLVNTLSQLGYIDSTPAVKRLFAYRFSGRMRPAKVAPIEWHGKNGNSYELIYMVRNMTERANYRKMRNFFFGPKWVADRDSSYARGADYRLKELLHKLYPTLPDQL
ncbi:MAG: hypothetical protein IJK07_02755 [Bacteroidales bacterium]|nr:hypothetical protein [Bacteroidales bacterium]